MTTITLETIQARLDELTAMVAAYNAAKTTVAVRHIPIGD